MSEKYTKDETIFSCFKQNKKDNTNVFAGYIFLILNKNLVSLKYVKRNISLLAIFSVCVFSYLICFLAC